jgi:ATP-dependent Clp protease adaptor protein ClpS
VAQSARPDRDVLDKTRPVTKQPDLFQVVLHNDDYTTMEFVVEILERVFLKSPAEAFRIMIHVHTQGRGMCGVYPYEIAETKVEAVHQEARGRGFPLRASIEQE